MTKNEYISKQKYDNAISIITKLGFYPILIGGEYKMYKHDVYVAMSEKEVLKQYCDIPELIGFLYATDDTWQIKLTKQRVNIFQVSGKSNYSSPESINRNDYILALQNACIYYLEHRND